MVSPATNQTIFVCEKREFVALHFIFFESLRNRHFAKYRSFARVSSEKLQSYVYRARPMRHFLPGCVTSDYPFIWYFNAWSWSC